MLQKRLEKRDSQITRLQSEDHTLKQDSSKFLEILQSLQRGYEEHLKRRDLEI